MAEGMVAEHDDDASAMALASLLLLNSTLRYLVRRRLVDPAGAVMIVGDALYALNEGALGKADRHPVLTAATDQMMATLREIGGLGPAAAPGAAGPGGDAKD